MAPETEPQQGKETVLRFLKALTEIEPQINASGQLRYVISGSAAIFLYEHGKDISYIELTDGTGRPTEDYKEVSADRPIEKVFEPIPLDVEDREALSIRPPFRRLPSDIDIIPITDDRKLPDEVRPLSHDPLTD